jgi:DNA-binding MurR/RpiR family transcriptional regulator
MSFRARGSAPQEAEKSGDLYTAIVAALLNVARIPSSDYASRMERGPSADRIATALETMPGQLQMAARYVLTRPQDVVLPWRREQAGVQPAMITRLTQRLGLDGYKPVREFYAEAIRNEDLGLAGTPGLKVASRKLKGERALVADMVESLTNQIARLSQPDVMERLVAAAAPLALARRVYCLGFRAGRTIAWLFGDVLSPSGDGDVLPDAIAEGGRDSISCACSKDLLFAVGVEPCTRTAIKAARANKRGIPIAALTDSAMSPRPRAPARAPADGPSFSSNLTPTFAAIAAAFVGEASPAALRRTQAAFHVHRSQKPRAVRYRGLP